jgi:hypothetical protein
MVKKYLNHMNTKSTHERRQHALQVATIVTALVFVGWLGTLGLRLGNFSTTVASGSDQAQQTQLAGVINGAGMTSNTPNTLQVVNSTSSNY